MKLKLSFAIISVCAVALPAQADSPYVKLNYGRTFSDAQIIDRTDTIEAIADLDLAGGNRFGFAIGTDLPLSPRWGQFEWEGEFAYRTTNIDGVTITGNVPGGFIDGADLDNVNTYSLLGNIWWRPALFGQIRPYAGGGVGASYLPAGGLSADDIYSLAYQYGAGVDYEFGNGIRAGVGYRHFEISATDRDTSDPLFTFETESSFSEDSIVANATIPFAVFGGDPLRRSGGQSSDKLASNQAKAERQALKAREEADKRARKQAEKQAEREAKARRKAEKLARKEAEEKAKSQKPGFLRRINPFGDDESASETAETKVALREGNDDAFDNITISSVRPLVPPSQKPARATAPSNASLSKPAPAQPAAAAVQEKTYGAGQYYAQLGAYSSASFARDMWRSKSSRQPEVFNGANHIIGQTTRRSDNKTLYLLRVGPYDKSSAKAICALSAGECIVVGS
ncbi:MAG: outer membrane beta-barrel protein [Pseudomonadota bacterium]